MTISISKIISDAGVLLVDTGHTRWTETELLNAINDAQREIVRLKPEANTKLASVQLAAGTDQTLPSDGVQFFRIVRNMGASPGTTNGRAVRTVSMDAMDAQNLGWASEVASAEVRTAMFDPRAPLRYFVTPPNTGAQFVLLMYGAYPADCILAGNLNLPDAYATAVMYYACFRAMSKDAEYAAGVELARQYYALFYDGVMGKAQVEASRNQSAVGG